MEVPRGRQLPKFCPLSFFSFFINKNSSQSGGCMRCVESECAWWDEFLTEEGELIGQCGFMSLVDGVRNIDVPSLAKEKLLEKTLIPEEISLPKASTDVSEIFSKLRNLSNPSIENQQVSEQQVISTNLIVEQQPVENLANNIVVNEVVNG